MQANNQELSIVLCGAAGQGLQIIEDLLTKTLKKSGYYVYCTKEFMSRVRGGENSTSFRVASYPVRSPVDRMDFLFPFIDKAVEHVKERITPDTLIIGEKKFIENSPEYAHVEVPLEDIAKEVGGIIYENIIVLGLICGLLDADLEYLNEMLRDAFGRKGEEIMEQNLTAASRGYNLAIELTQNDENVQSHVRQIQKNPDITQDYLLNGERAVALGALAGGCNYCVFYPMSPAQGVPTFLARQDIDFSIIVDLSEDEISVMNKAIGASYAGARSMVSTSGGGFALMVEGLSFAAASELPVVIHLGQRPAPATGMPTHTEQGDLEFALYAGHGPVPRILLAPSSIEEGFYLTQKAFNLAAKYQVPVFVITDQYFIDTSYNVHILDYAPLPVEKYFVETTPDYKRYLLTEDGVSPWGLPGYGEGVSRADSHTHDEAGMISEEATDRTQMVDKAYKKLAAIKLEAIPPVLVGSPDYTTLVVSWGSTYDIIVEALAKLGRADVAFLHFSQVFPLHTSTREYVQKAQKVIAIENNATGQFANILQLETSRRVDAKILKYSGYCFSVEELVARLQTTIGGE